MTKTPRLLKSVLAILCCNAAITGWCQASPLWGNPGPVLVYQRPIDAMVDVTNDLGVAVLQDYAYTRSNFAFSPYGVASVLVVLYEGARGESARQIHNVLRLPWNRDVTRIGFRDIHRHLRGYFSHEGYLSGLTLNKLNTSLLPEYRRVLRFYGYDVGLADEYGPFPPRRPSTTTTTTSSPETEPETPTTISGTTNPVECKTETETTTKETTLTTLVSEEDKTLETTTESFSSAAPDETSPTTPVSVADTSTIPVSSFTTTMDTSSPTTVTETSPTDATASVSVPATTEDTSEPYGPASGITTTMGTFLPTVTETTLTDATKAEEIPSTIQGSSTASYTPTENTFPAFTGVEETFSTMTATERSSEITKATSSPEQPITSTLPTSLEESTAIKESTVPSFTGVAEDTSSPTIAVETSSIEAATTKAAILPVQPITSTVPTSLEEITTITQSTESVFGGTEDTLPVTVFFPGDATTVQPKTTVPTSLPEVTTVRDAKSGFTDTVKGTLPTTAMDSSTTQNATTNADILPEQSITSTVPTTLEDRTIIQTFTGLVDETVETVQSSIDAATIASIFPEQTITSTVPNTLKDITSITDNTMPVFTGTMEGISLPMTSVETSTADAETVPAERTASTIPTTLEQMTTTIGSTISVAAKLRASTTPTSPLVQKETTVVPKETIFTTTPVDFTTKYSGGNSSTDYTTGAVTSTLSIPNETFSLESENSSETADMISELPFRTAKLLKATNTSTAYVERTSSSAEIIQYIAATTEDAAASITAAESPYKNISEDRKEVVDVNVATEANKSEELKMPLLRRGNMTLESEPEDSFILELATVFTEALGSLKNESHPKKTNSTKRGAKVDGADMPARGEIKSNGTSVSWNHNLTNKSYKMPLHFTDKTNEEYGEMPSVNLTRSKRAVSENPVVFFPDISLQLQNGMFDSQVSRGYDLFGQLHRRPFLIDGVTEELVPVMSYTSVFPYAYIHSLHAQALEFPLDDERYRLLILLPVERRGLRQLIYDLNSCPLRTVFEALKPTRVQAIIPSFMVEGFVILTPTLQQLGVWDVFDPRRADLSGMSSDPELYVRNIEQAVTVVIRNYVKILDIQTRTLTARTMLQLFAATHPFLYFVVDTDTHVSLIAGKMVDPLNSRIY